MAFRKQTLRRMAPTSRKLAKLIGELESTTRRLKHLLEEVSRQERDAAALKFAKDHRPAAPELTQGGQVAKPPVSYAGGAGSTPAPATIEPLFEEDSP